MWRGGSEQSVPRFSLCLSVLIHRPLIVVFSSSSMFLFPPLQGAEPNQPYDNVSLLIIEPSGSTGKQQPLRSSLIHPILLVVLFRRLGRNPPAWPPAHLPTAHSPTPHIHHATQYLGSCTARCNQQTATVTAPCTCTCTCFLLLLQPPPAPALHLLHLHLALAPAPARLGFVFPAHPKQSGSRLC